MDFLQAQIRAASNGQQHTLGAFHGGFQQRRIDGLFGGIHHPVVAPSRAHAHERGTRVRHDGTHVGEVHVDETRYSNQVCNTLHTIVQHLVGGPEGLHHGEVGRVKLQQPVIGDDDERVAHLPQGFDALQRLPGALLPLKIKRPRDDAHGERTHLLGDGSHHGGGTGAGTTTLTSGDEHHVGTLEGFFDFAFVVFRRLPTHLGVGTGAETTSGLPTNIEFDVSVGEHEGLRIGVHGNELDAFQALFNHAVHRVDATTANTDNFKYGEEVILGVHKYDSSFRLDFR